MNYCPLSLDSFPCSLHSIGVKLYLIRKVLKLPVIKSTPWFSARAKPRPTARTIRVKVAIRVNTKLTAHRSNLRNDGEVMVNKKAYHQSKGSYVM